MKLRIQKAAYLALLLSLFMAPTCILLSVLPGCQNTATTQPTSQPSPQDIESVQVKTMSDLLTTMELGAAAAMDAGWLKPATYTSSIRPYFKAMGDGLHAAGADINAGNKTQFQVDFDAATTALASAQKQMAAAKKAN